MLIVQSCKKEQVPTLTTTAISNITPTTATSGGNITNEGSSTITTRGVCWSTGTTPTIADNKTIDGAGAGSFSSNIINLFGGTTYFVRAYATNSTGTGYGMALSFNTSGLPPSPPTITNQNASNIQLNSAQLNGTVNANYYSTIVSFEYGTSTSYGSTATATQNPVTGNTNTSVSANISGLTAATTYHYRIEAVNSLGTTFSNDTIFTTAGQPPKVTTFAPTNTSPSGAQLNGTVNANYLSTVVTFEYGATTNYGSTVTATQSPVKGSTNTIVSAIITGLTYNMTYYFRLVATNSLGTSYGSNISFTAVYRKGGNFYGGIIVYVDSTGQHGLVCAPTDQNTGIQWGCYGTTISGANGLDFGTGRQNTIDIVNGCSTGTYAAKICHDLVLNGYNDWYLPSLRELYLMGPNASDGGLSYQTYWSSSQKDGQHAWTWSFMGQDYGPKNSFNYVRAVRSF